MQEENVKMQEENVAKPAPQKMPTWYEANFKAVSLAEPCRDGLIEVTEAPIYNTPDSEYKHVTLRATCNLPKSLPIMRESPVSFVPTMFFSSSTEQSFQDPKNQGRTVDVGDFVIQPLGEQQIKESAAEKDRFFQQGWPLVSPFLVGFRNREVLQLVCSLILRTPEAAAAYGGPDAKYAGMHFVDGEKDKQVDFVQYLAVMHSLYYYKCPKKNLRPWLRIADFSRLYNAIRRRNPGTIWIT